MKRIFYFIAFLSSQWVFAQLAPTYQHHTERDQISSDSNSLQAILRKGTFNSHARYYFMATDNEAGLTDFFAHAFGMGIGYETGKFHGFQMGLSGYFIYNLYSTNLTTKDPTTGQPSRYELGQFDMLNPANRHDMDRLEDLYLKYSYKNSFIKLGKQHIRTPFINPQDGRMRPTLVEGLLVEWNPARTLKVEGGLLYGISPRGTVNWFNIGKSIGVFPAGVNPNGKKSGYPGQLISDAVYYGGLTITPNKSLKLEVWNMHIDRILNTSMAQAMMRLPVGSTSSQQVIVGAQYIYQTTVGNGGNANPDLTFATPDAFAQTYGFRLGYAREKNWSLLLNYNRITDDGRYLMPREWGRDPFFTFMARERNEGFSDVHAWNGVFSKTFGKSGWKAEWSYGHYYLPDVNQTVSNKYGMPSYWQNNLDVRYRFNGFLNGLEAQFLYVYKGLLGETYGNEKYTFNKTNMSLYNLIINYHF